MNETIMGCSGQINFACESFFVVLEVTRCELYVTSYKRPNLQELCDFVPFYLCVKELVKLRGINLENDLSWSEFTKKLIKEAGTDWVYYCTAKTIERAE